MGRQSEPEALAALAGAATASPRRAQRAGSGRHLVGCWLEAAHGKERHQVGIDGRLAGAGLVARSRGGRRALAVSSVAGSPPLEDARARRLSASPAALMATRYTAWSPGSASAEAELS